MAGRVGGGMVGRVGIGWPGGGVDQAGEVGAGRVGRPSGWRAGLGEGGTNVHTAQIVEE